MSEALREWSPDVNLTRYSIKIDDLTIGFQRTVRVPDTEATHNLPPSLGSFPLYRTDDYVEKMPVSMAQKGGLFFPMYQKEALWINCDSRKTYAIKIYVGNVNAISGEPAIPTGATNLCRRKTLLQGESIQDYIIVPYQDWLDGIAVQPGKVRQFIAMPMGKGYSVEAQVTGQETTGGIQFEVTRLDAPLEPFSDEIAITLSGPNTDEPIKTSVQINESTTILDLAAQLCDEMKIPLASIRRGVDVDGDWWRNADLVKESGIKEGSEVHFRPEQIGGGPAPPRSSTPPHEMSIAAGGLIQQSIFQIEPEKYRKSCTVTFNVQVLNSAGFRAITGHNPPPSPISAKTYAEIGLPFYAIYEEPATIAGDFDRVRSVAQIEGQVEDSLPRMPVIDVESRVQLTDWTCSFCYEENHAGLLDCESCHRRRSNISGYAANPHKNVGVLNPQGPHRPFKFAWEEADELNQIKTLF